MEVIFLGTSQAVPTETRNHTSILLNYDEEMIMIDCGEGTQRQFRKMHLNPCKLTKMLITHWHGDHTLGIPGLLQTLALNNYNRTLDIYGPKGTKRYMDMILKMFIFSGDIKLNVHELDRGKFFEHKKFYLEAFPVKHSAASLAYSFTEKDRIRIDKKKIKMLGLKGPIIGELQRGKDITFNGKKIKAKDITYSKKGKKVAVVMDTEFCPACIEAAKNADLLITESTYTNELADKAKAYQHLTAGQAGTIAKKAKAKVLYLTHISQRFDRNPEVVLKDAKKVFRNTKIAEDFMKIEL